MRSAARLLACVLLWWCAGFGAASPAAAQSCTRYLSANDGSDASDGTTAARAVRSFDHAYTAFPDGAVVCTKAGEYFYAADRDGIALRSASAKSMTFVLQPFSGSNTVRLSEDFLVVDAAGGTVTFEGTDVTLVLGRGSTNSPTDFPDNQGFLHSLSLLSGTLDTRGVPVRVEASVGVPGYVLPGTARTAPDTTALTRADGRWLAGTVTYEAAPRTVRYTGTTTYDAGPELPADLGTGALHFAHAAGTVTLPTAPTLAAGARLTLQGGGHAVFARELVFPTDGTSAVAVASGAGGDLRLPSGLRIVATAAPDTVVSHRGRGTLQLGRLTMGPPAGGNGAAGWVVLGGPGTLELAALDQPANAGERRPTHLLHRGTGQLVLGAPGQTLSLYGDLLVRAAGRARLAGPLTLQGRLDQRGTLSLGSASLALQGTGPFHNGGPITATPGGFVQLSGAPALTGAGALPEVRILAGAPRLDALRLEGALEVRAGAGGALPFATHVGGRVRLEGAGTLTFSRPVDVLGAAHVQGAGTLAFEQAADIRGDVVVEGAGTLAFEQAADIRGDVVVEGAGTLTLDQPTDVAGDVRLAAGSLEAAATLSIVGSYVQQGANTTFASQGDTLAVGGNLVWRGGAFSVSDLTLLLDGARPQALELAAPLSPDRLVLHQAGTEVSLQGAGLDVTAAVQLEAGTALHLGPHTLQLAGAQARIDNHGRLTDDGTGRLRLAGPSTQYLAGKGSFGTLEVRLEAPTARVEVETDTLRHRGALLLSRGHLDLNDRPHRYLGPGALPLQRSLTDGPDANLLLGASAFNVTARPVSLTYAGTVSTNVPPGPEFVADTQDLTIATTGNGAVQLRQDRSLPGTLTVAAGAGLDVAGHLLTLPATGVVHPLHGTVRSSQNGFLQVTGSGTLQAHPSGDGAGLVEALLVRSSGTVILEGLLHLGAPERPGLVVGSGTVVLRLARGEATGVVHRFLQTGGRSRLAADARVIERFEVRGGTYEVTDADLVLASGGAFSLGSTAALEAPEAAGGWVRFEGSGTLSSGTHRLPRLRLEGGAGHRVTLTGPSGVRNALEDLGGTLRLGGQTFTHAGQRWLVPAGADYGTEGTFTVIGAVVATFGADVTLPTLLLAGGTLTLTAPEGAAVPRLVLRGPLRLEDGLLDHRAMDVWLQDPVTALDYQSGRLFSTPPEGRAGGRLVAAGGGAAAIRLARSLTIPRLEVRDDTVLPSTRDTLRILHGLVYGQGALTTRAPQLLRFAPDSRIVRRGDAALTFRPVYEGPFHLSYDLDGTTPLNAPELVTGLEYPGPQMPLRTLTIRSGRTPDGTPRAVRLSAAVTVEDTLALVGGRLNTTTAVPVLAAGATLRLEHAYHVAPAFIAPTGRAFGAAGALHLVFGGRTGGFSTDDALFPPDVRVTSLTVAMGAADTGTPYTLHLHAPRTVDRLLVKHALNEAAFDLGAHALSVTGDAVLQRGLLEGSGTLVLGGHLTQAAAASLAPSLALTLTGNRQTLSLHGTPRLRSLAVQQTGVQPRTVLAPDTRYTLALDTLTLARGLLATGTNAVQAQVVRRAATASAPRHVVGTLERPAGTAPLRFALGTSYPEASFRPATLDFSQAPAPGTVLRVTHHPTPPGGALGFPLEDDAGTVFVDAAAFSWDVAALPGPPPAGPFTLTVAAEGFDGFAPNRVDALRLVHRTPPAPTAPWALLEGAAAYHNAFVDGVPTVEVTTAVSLPATGRRFSIGLEEAFAAFGTVHVVHAAPDTSLPALDVFLSGTLWVEALPYAEGTAALRLTPGTYTVRVAVAGAGPAAGLAERSLTVDAGDRTALVALGLTAPSAYPANPDGLTARFGLEAYALADAPAGEVPVLFVPALPDARPVDLAPLPPVASYATPIRGAVPSTREAFFTLSQGPFTLAQRGVPLAERGSAYLLVVGTGFVTDDAALPAPALSFFDAEGRIEGLSVPVAVDPTETLPATFALHGNYPNPFNPSTTLRFDLPEAAEVAVTVYDLLGRRVLTLPPRPFAAGTGHTLRLEADGLASGTYLYHLTARTPAALHRATGRMVLVK